VPNASIKNEMILIGLSVGNSAWGQTFFVNMARIIKSVVVAGVPLSMLGEF